MCHCIICIDRLNMGRRRDCKGMETHGAPHLGGRGGSIISGTPPAFGPSLIGSFNPEGTRRPEVFANHRRAQPKGTQGKGEVSQGRPSSFRRECKNRLDLTIDSQRTSDGVTESSCTSSTWLERERFRDHSPVSEFGLSVELAQSSG